MVSSRDFCPTGVFSFSVSILSCDISFVGMVVLLSSFACSIVSSSAMATSLSVSFVALRMSSSCSFPMAHNVVVPFLFVCSIIARMSSLSGRSLVWSLFIRCSFMFCSSFEKSYVIVSPISFSSCFICTFSSVFPKRGFMNLFFRSFPGPDVSSSSFCCINAAVFLISFSCWFDNGWSSSSLFDMLSSVSFVSSSVLIILFVALFDGTVWLLSCLFNADRTRVIELLNRPVSYNLSIPTQANLSCFSCEFLSCIVSCIFDRFSDIFCGILFCC